MVVITKRYQQESLSRLLVGGKLLWWKITLDLGGSSATIKHSIRIIQA